MLVLTFSLSAPDGAVRVPPPVEPARADQLWQTTCFEAFIRGEGMAYVELNFSPSGQWAAYRFDDYRQGMRELDGIEAPAVEISTELGQVGMTASIALPQEFMGIGLAFGLSAVVEEVGGTKSYWALVHSDGGPDFHHPDCFAARLP